jgi:hypothetical protein
VNGGNTKKHDVHEERVYRGLGQSDTTTSSRKRQMTCRTGPARTPPPRGGDDLLRLVLRPEPENTRALCCQTAAGILVTSPTDNRRRTRIETVRQARPLHHQDYMLPDLRPPGSRLLTFPDELQAGARIPHGNPKERSPDCQFHLAVSLRQPPATIPHSALASRR